MSSTRSTSPGSGSRRREASVRAAVTAVVLGGIVLFLALTGPDNGWDWGRVWGRFGDDARSGWPQVFLRALGTTVLVSLGALLVSIVLGFAGGLARLSRRPWLSQLAVLYVEVVRGTPLLVQLFVAVYCVGYALGLDDPMLVGTLTLGVFAGAYVTEIVRSAIESVDPGQVEAALSQGMSPRQALRHVLLPQALRRMLPPMTGELVSLVKDSSLLGVVGVLEISKRAREAMADTHRTFEIFLPLAVLYLAITFPLSRLARRLELAVAGP
jgi:polar amino acid transport system permease protein